MASLRMLTDEGPTRIEVRGDEATLWNGPRRQGLILSEPDPQETARLINEHPEASRLFVAEVSLTGSPRCVEFRLRR